MPEFDLPSSFESGLAQRIREVIGVGDFEQVRVAVPQFERLEGEVWLYPDDAETLDALRSAPKDVLRSTGCRCWKDDLWLFPGEWFSCIPEGYPVVNILEEEKSFDPDEMSRDIRFGCLSYGFRRDG